MLEKKEVSLRLLKEKDAAGMLEWMHDPSISKFFQFDAAGMSLEKVQKFIEDSLADAKANKNFHFAIVDMQDEYLGTISLKNIDCSAKAAEYAVCLRKMAQGTGVALIATKLLLEYAFEDMALNRVFLNVLSENTKAIHLYEKCGFVYEGEFRQHIYAHGELKNLKWYSLLRDEYVNLVRFTERD